MQQHKTMFANAMRNVQRLLPKHPKALRDSIVAQLNEIKNNEELWQQVDDGLALFISEDETWAVNLPITTDTLTRVSNVFFLAPIMSLMDSNNRVSIVLASGKNAKAWTVTNTSINKLNIDLPATPEEALKIDEYQQEQQHHATGDGNVAYHAHGGGNDDDSTEAQYLRIIGKILAKHHSKTVPIILAGQHKQRQVVREQLESTHCLYDESVGNITDEQRMAERARDIVAKKRMKRIKVLLQEYKSMQRKQQATAVNQVISRALSKGKVGTLLLNIRKTTKDHIRDNEIELSKFMLARQENLDEMEAFARQAYASGASVVGINEGQSPESSRISAIMRY